MSSDANTTQKNTRTPRRRSNSLGTSPTLRASTRKRGRVSESVAEEGHLTEPEPKKMATNSKQTSSCKENDILAVVMELKKSVDKLNNQMPTKDEMKKMEENIKVDVHKNTTNIQKLFDLRKEDNDCFKKRVLDAVGGDSASRQETSPGPDRVNDFLIARRSLRVWPIHADQEDLVEGCVEFFACTLDMPGDVANNVGIESVRKLDQTRRSKITDEVLIRFTNARDRDIVQSYAVNLARHKDKAGIKLEIPPHLLSSFKILEQHAGALRAKYQTGLKRSVKFDDASMDLIMDVKIPTNLKWQRLTVSQIKKANQHRDRLPTRQGTSDHDPEEHSAALLVGGGLPVVEEEDNFEDANQN